VISEIAQSGPARGWSLACHRPYGSIHGGVSAQHIAVCGPQWGGERCGRGLCTRAAGALQQSHLHQPRLTLLVDWFPDGRLVRTGRTSLPHCCRGSHSISSAPSCVQDSICGLVSCWPVRPREVVAEGIPGPDGRCKEGAVT
jgi:hypothetical protein